MSADEAMDEARFEGLLAAYGADARRWPDAERAQALRLLAMSPAAHARRAEAMRLDAALHAWRLGPPPADLQARIAAAAPLARLFRPRVLWASAAGLAAACLLGVMLGAGVGPTLTAAQPAADSAVTAALDGASEYTPSLDAEGAG